MKNEGDYFLGGRRFGKGLLTMHWLCTGTHSEMAVRTEYEHVGPAGPFLTITTSRNEIRQHRALTVAHLAVALHANARHEALRAGDVRDEIPDAVGMAIAIAKAHVSCGDTGQRALARRSVWIGPRVEPGVDRWRPPQETKTPGLFLAGDWTATGWPAKGLNQSGTEALASAVSPVPSALTRYVPDTGMQKSSPPVRGPK